MGSVWGNAIKLSIFGESHGGGIGCVLDGFPAGVPYDEAFILAEMDRRAPGKNRQSTARREKDLPKVLSGVFEGKTSGAPISCVIENTDTRSKDYRNLIEQPASGTRRLYRPRALSGLQRLPRRRTLFRPLDCAAGVCRRHVQAVLRSKGIEVGSHISAIGQIMDTPFDDVHVPTELLAKLRTQAYPVINPRAEEAMLVQIDQAREAQDSVGGIIECAVTGVPVGIGSPMLSPVEGRLSSILFSVPAVKGVEFGAGFSIAAMRGSEANDCMYLDGDTVKTETNNNGGILGGITNGMADYRSRSHQADAVHLPRTAHITPHRPAG